MSLLMFLKVFGDICVCYCVMGSLPSLFYHEFSLMWPALLGGAGAAIGTFFTEQGRPEARFAGLILPLLSLMLAGSVMDLVLLAPALAYTAVIIIRGELSLEYYSFREVYLRTLKGIGIFAALISFFGYFESMASRDISNFDASAALRFGLIYAVSGVVLLRQLRLGNESKGQSRFLSGAQLGGLAVGTGVMTAAVLALEKLLHKNAASIWSLIIQLIAFVVSIPIKLVIWLADILFPDGTSIPEQNMEATTSTGSTVQAPGPLETVVDTVTQQEPGFPWWLVILILAVLIGMLVFLLSTFRRNGRTAAVSDPATVIEPPAREKKGSRRSNRANVRRLYREFLKSERKRGLKLQTNQTSKDILDSVSARTDRRAAADLRRIYLKARYAEKAGITAEDVKAARAALAKAKEKS